MKTTTIKIKCWVCPECNYHQDFEPTDELMLKHFQREGANCPSCGKVELIRETREDHKTTINIMNESEVDALEVESGENDGNGEPILRNLTSEEKTEKRKKIKDALKKFRALEDK